MLHSAVVAVMLNKSDTGNAYLGHVQRLNLDVWIEQLLASIWRAGRSGPADQRFV